MPAYVTDTHPVVWYASRNHAKLSRRVLRAFDMAARDEALIYIPAVVLWEIGLLSKLGRIKLREPFDQWAAALLSKPGFQIIPLDAELVARAVSLSLDDPFDAAVVACALSCDLQLMTKDLAISESGLVKILW
ncbi:MAG: type II toxin-antitoxin system VapC family toxin [Acidobacteriota bacterium]|nr:type II toxin-antitoxin system VapC family toxin [Acidobacteriota bacterium]